MVINPDSIKAIHEDFEEVEETLMGTNYQIEIAAKKFSFDGDSDFSLENLKFLFEDQFEVDGEIKKVNWGDIETYVNKILRYTYDGDGVDFQGSILPLVSNERWESRKKMFWGKVENHIAIPPEKSYWHIPKPGTVFADFIMWGFCAILINEDLGIVLVGGAYD
jgi:hypothetical protein